MKLRLIIGAILLLAAGGFGVSRLIWTSPDYAATGVCTAAQIDQTYAALEAAHGFDKVSRDRAHFEYWAYHSHIRTLRTTFETSLNTYIYRYTDRRKTAGYVCSHLNPYFRVRPYFKTFPELLAAIRPLSHDAGEAARVATCVYNRETYSPRPLSQLEVERLDKVCAVRRE